MEFGSDFNLQTGRREATAKLFVLLMEKGGQEVFPHPALTFLCSVVCLFSCFNSLLTGREILGVKELI